jgi:hypothetical protein
LSEIHPRVKTRNTASFVFPFCVSNYTPASFVGNLARENDCGKLAKNGLKN